jgi:hypothetical protein
MADDWELTVGLNPTDGADLNLVDSSGYTMLEKFINSFYGIPDTTVVVPIDTTVVVPIDTTVVPVDTTVVVPIDTTVVTSVSHNKFEPKLVVYPNPAIGNTCIRFNLSQEELVKVEIISLTGGMEKIVAYRSFQKGIHKVGFDASGLAKGLYLCRVSISTRSPQIVRFLVQ